MKKLLLTVTLVVFGSSLSATESEPTIIKKECNNTHPAVITQMHQPTITDLIKQNPWTAFSVGLVLGTLIPAKTKLHVLMGGVAGAVIVLKVTDKNFSDAVDRSFSTVTEKYSKTKEALIEKWNDFLTPKRD